MMKELHTYFAACHLQNILPFGIIMVFGAMHAIWGFIPEKGLTDLALGEN